MPRCSSTVMYQPQMFTPERPFQPSFSHVRGRVHRAAERCETPRASSPVRASKARVSPGGPSGTSPTVAPSMTTFLKTSRYAVPRHADVGDAVDAETLGRLTRCRVQRNQTRARVARARFAGLRFWRPRREHHAFGAVAIARPVAKAPRPSSRRPGWRSARFPFLSPRRAPESGCRRPAGTSRRSRRWASLPDLTGFRAHPALARGPGRVPGPAARRASGSTRACRFETFSAVTCFRGENLVPARSRPYIGQSPSASRSASASLAGACSKAVRRFLGLECNGEHGQAHCTGQETKWSKTHRIPPEWNYTDGCAERTARRMAR